MGFMASRNHSEGPKDRMEEQFIGRVINEEVMEVLELILLN